MKFPSYHTVMAGCGLWLRCRGGGGAASSGGSAGTAGRDKLIRSHIFSTVTR